MKSVIWLATALAVLGMSSAAISFGNFTDSRHPGKCFIDDHLILSAGETVQHPDMCGSISCGEEGFSQFITCGVVVPPKGCKAVYASHKIKTYPDCCQPEFICA